MPSVDGFLLLAGVLEVVGVPGLAERVEQRRRLVVRARSPVRSSRSRYMFRHVGSSFGVKPVASSARLASSGA